jgi:hypothetical protein
VKSTLKRKHLPVVLKIGIALGVLFIFSHFCAWTIDGNAWFYSRTYTVKRLAEVLPVLKDYHLKEYRNQGWCKVMSYKLGDYWTSSDPDTCVLQSDIDITAHLFNNLSLEFEQK